MRGLNIVLFSIFLVGHVYVDKSPISLEKLSYHEELKQVQKGGWWQPYYCGERNNVRKSLKFSRRHYLVAFTN